MGSPPGCGELRAMVKPPLPWLKPRFCLRTFCFHPVGGVGDGLPPSHAPFSVFDPEGWRERPIRGLGQISILSWKLRIQSVHTHPRPQISPLQPGEFAELSGHPPSISIQTDTVGTECKATVLILFPFVEWGQGGWKLSVEELGMGAPKDWVQTFPFHSHICCVALGSGGAWRHWRM